LDWLECSYLTAGTALVGAGAIALSPINPAVSASRDVQVGSVVSEAEVGLVAAVNPFQTWLNVVDNAVNNVSTVSQAMWALPTPLAQQVLANLINYAAIDIGAYQTAAAAAVTYFGGTEPGSFQWNMQLGVTQLQAGNISDAVSSLENALILTPFSSVLQPMGSALQIGQLIAANLSNAVNYLLSSHAINPTGFIAQLGATFLLGIIGPLADAVGTDLQSAYGSAVAGDWLGVIASLADLPGQLTNALLNGGNNTGIFHNNGATGGLLGSSTLVTGPGLLATLLLVAPRMLASAIVTPGEQNIVTGGSVYAGWQNFLTQLTTDWPSPSEMATIPAGVVAGFQGVPQAVFGALAAAVHGLISGAAATAALAGSAGATAPAAAASPVSPAAQTVNLSIPKSLTASAADAASSSKTAANDPSDQHTATGTSAPRPRVHGNSTAGDSSATDITTGANGDSSTTGGTDTSRSTAAQGYTRSVGKRHSPSGSARHGNTAGSGSGSGSGK
jgi:hypothetical protein